MPKEQRANRASLRLVKAVNDVEIDAPPKKAAPTATTASKSRLKKTLSDFPASGAKRKPTRSAERSRAPKRASQRAARIFQIFFEDWHEPLLDPEFEP